MSTSDVPPLASVSAEAYATFHNLYGRSLADEDAMMMNVRQYLDLVRHAAITNEFIAVANAEALTRNSLELLGSVRPETPEPVRRLIQAAVRYFLMADDADDDLSSATGFDDDVEVMNAVVRRLQRPDLLIC